MWSIYGRPSLRRSRTIVWLFIVGSLLTSAYYLNAKKDAVNEAKLNASKYLGVGPGAATHKKLDVIHLRKFPIWRGLEYGHRSIRTVHLAGDRPLLTTFEEPLFPSIHHVDGDDLKKANVYDDYPPLVLKVPFEKKPNFSVMSFGMATTSARLNDSIPALQSWLRYTGASLLVSIPIQDDETQVKELETRMHNLGINAMIITSDEPHKIQCISLIRKLYEIRNINTEWFALIDDDTFIPSLSALVNRFKTAYDSSKQQVVSAVTENKTKQEGTNTSQCGGGGIFMSLPLVQQVSDVKTFQACRDFDKDRGDTIVSDCISKHTDVKPVFDQDLYQLGLKGDVSGLFESGRTMLSINHWKSWFKLDVALMAKVGRACGSAGVFQRWSFPRKSPLPDGSPQTNETWVLSNGYSIVKYGEGFPNNFDAGAMEMTWDGQTEEFDPVLGPLRPSLLGSKFSYTLIDARALKTGVRQTYAHYNSYDLIDAVFELLWLYG